MKGTRCFKKIAALVMVFLMAWLFMPMGAHSYQVIINNSDPAIGADFQTTQMTYNVNENPFTVDIKTVYPLAGITVGAWPTVVADLFLYGQASGFIGAIPIVNHDGLISGELYAVTGVYTSDQMAAKNGISPADSSSGYIWGFGQVSMMANGVDQGMSGTWSQTPTGLAYLANNWYWSDLTPPGDYLSLQWATADCANSMIGNVVTTPIPAAVWLLGTGLVGLVGIRRRNQKVV